MSRNDDTVIALIIDTLRELYAFGSRTNWTIGLDRINVSPTNVPRKQFTGHHPHEAGPHFAVSHAPTLQSQQSYAAQHHSGGPGQYYPRLQRPGRGGQEYVGAERGGRGRGGGAGYGYVGGRYAASTPNMSYRTQYY